MTIKLSDFEIGWLVGILEGEGYFEYNGCSQKVSLRMTDEDTVNTYSIMVGKIIEKDVRVSSIYPEGNRLELFRCEIHGEDARTLMRLVTPYMHYRRRARIWQSLNKWRSPKKTLNILELIKTGTSNG